MHGGLGTARKQANDFWVWSTGVECELQSLDEAANARGQLSLLSNGRSCDRESIMTSFISAPNVLVPCCPDDEGQLHIDCRTATSHGRSAKPQASALPHAHAAFVFGFARRRHHAPFASMTASASGFAAAPLFSLAR